MPRVKQACGQCSHAYGMHRRGGPAMACSVAGCGCGSFIDTETVMAGLVRQAILPDYIAAKAPGDLTLVERLKLAKVGQARPDGSFPIRSLADLTQHAMPSFGRAGDKGAVKSWLLKRARELKAGDAVLKRIQGYST